jgi:hypothetical protein
MSDQPDREQLDMEQNAILAAWLTDYREAFQGGDKMALLECVIFCDTSDVPLPRWALAKLAAAADAYISRTSENFHDAIFGAALKPVGRHAQAATKRRDEVEHQRWFDIVWALKQQGYKGNDLSERAINEISKGHLRSGRREKAYQPRRVPTAETQRKTVQRMQKAGARPKFAFMFMPCGPLPTKPASE